MFTTTLVRLQSPKNVPKIPLEIQCLAKPVKFHFCLSVLKTEMSAAIRPQPGHRRCIRVTYKLLLLNSIRSTALCPRSLPHSNANWSGAPCLLSDKTLCLRYTPSATKAALISLSAPSRARAKLFLDTPHTQAFVHDFKSRNPLRDTVHAQKKSSHARQETQL
jgi:hypothetical protein